MKNSDPPIIIEDIYEAPIEKVWKAVTEVNQMREWFFPQIPDFKAEVGFETTFTVQVKERIFPHIWRIVEVTQGLKIVYEWKYENYIGLGYITFELSDNSGETKIKLTCIVSESFQEGIPEFKRESGIAGWNWFIKNSLKAYVEN